MAKEKLPDWFVKQLSKAGKVGGKRSLETMTAAERIARAKKAAAKSAIVRAKKSAEKKGK